MSDYDFSDFTERARLSVERAFANTKPPKTAGSLKERKLLELNGLLVAAKMLEERVTTVTTQLGILDSFPDEDPYVDGDTLEFERDFPGGGKTYSYAARRIDDLWYVTGAKSPQGVDWSEFISWLGLGLKGELHLVRKRPVKRASRARKTTP